MLDGELRSTGTPETSKKAARASAATAAIRVRVWLWCGLCVCVWMRVLRCTALGWVSLGMQTSGAVSTFHAATLAKHTHVAELSADPACGSGSTPIT